MTPGMKSNIVKVGNVTRTIKNEFIPIILLGLILVALIAAGIQGLPAPLPMLRLLLGLAFVLFVPGYTLGGGVWGGGVVVAVEYKVYLPLVLR